MSDRFIPNPEQVDDKLINSRIEKWCQAVAKGDREQFAKHLAWEELELEKISPLFGSVCLSNKEILPGWTETLGEILLNQLEIEDPLSDRCLTPEKPIPFEEVLLLLVRVARQKLRASVDSGYHLLSEEALITLERSLLKQLASICVQCFQLEFSIFRALKQSSLTKLLGQVQNRASKKLYQDFVNQLTTGGLLPFFKKYSTKLESCQPQCRYKLMHLY